MSRSKHTLRHFIYAKKRKVAKASTADVLMSKFLQKVLKKSSKWIPQVYKKLVVESCKPIIMLVRAMRSSGYTATVKSRAMVVRLSVRQMPVLYFRKKSIFQIPYTDLRNLVKCDTGLLESILIE